jgi:type II secretory pathway pseudopilin PulG
MLNKNSGQALLVVLISLAAIVTVVLSIVSRSVSGVRSTTKEEESTRAFSAAEAGVEKALISGTTGSIASEPNELDNAAYQANVTNYAQGSTSFIYPKDLASGDTATVWFVSHDGNGDLACNPSTLPCFTGTQMRICWGTNGAIGATTPAVEVSILYDPTSNKNYNDLAVARAAFDPNGARRAQNSFTAAGGSCTIGSTTFPFSATIVFNSLGIPAASYNSQNGLQLTTVRMLYNTTQDEPFAVDVSGSGGLLPGQGRRVESTGQSGEASRKVQVYTTNGELPSVFQSAVFSLGGITK